MLEGKYIDSLNFVLADEKENNKDFILWKSVCYISREITTWVKEVFEDGCLLGCNAV